MKSFRDQFQAPSRQKWMEKAEKELKGKPLEDLSWQIDQDLIVPPIFFETEVDHLFSPPARMSNWTIGDKYTVSDPSQTNKDLLAALDMGLEGAHLKLTKSLNKAEWTSLFDQVILTYITLVVDASDLPAEQLNGLAEYLQDQEWTKEQLIIFAKDQANCPSTLQACLRTKYQFSISLEDNVEQLYAQLNTAEAQLQKQKHGSNQHLFQIKLSPNFYLNIIYIQALSIIWQNILDANGLDPHTPIYIQAIVADDGTLDENTQKINATVQAVSAVVAGVDYLQIETADQIENKSFNRRINRNIQHLLKLESFMDYVENPSAGAYYFDNLTKEFTEKVWAKFTNS